MKGSDIVKEEEIFMPIDGYDNYIISSYGRVLNKNTMKELTQYNNRDRKCVSLSYNGIKRNYYVHRLVAEAFVPKPCYGISVIHIDGDKSNNYYKNLEWI